MYKTIKRKYKKLASWLRYNPKAALSVKGWRLFNEEFKKNAPIRYYFNYKFRRDFIYPINRKYHAVRDWILYRTTHRYHFLNTGLKPGYYEIETKMLHVNFNMLKDFVEVEQAQIGYWSSDEYKIKASWCEKYIPFYYKVFPFRRPDLGVKHFEWASTLDDPNLPLYERSEIQAIQAREILVLYKWWTEIRPYRKEIECVPYDDQGLGIFGCLDDDFNKEAEDYKAHIESMDKANKQDEDWKNEDEEMLIRLIKIRNALWT